MPLPAGTRIGPCEILAPIGAGGMGEVYRAKDTRLDRKVAVKVLFEGPFELETGYRNFDVSPDGRRFVTIQSDEGPLDRLVCVLNWFDELKRLVSAKH